MVCCTQVCSCVTLGELHEKMILPRLTLQREIGRKKDCFIVASVYMKVAQEDNSKKWKTQKRQGSISNTS